MSRLCYGYTIRDGRLEVQETEAENIRKFFKNYLAGNALIKSADLAGLKKNSSSVKRMLTNEKYLGNEIYPKIIDRESCLLYTSPSPRDRQKSRMPSSA